MNKSPVPCKPNLSSEFWTIVFVLTVAACLVGAVVYVVLGAVA